MSDGQRENEVTLESVSAQVSELRDLFVRRLYEDKNTKALVQQVNASLERRDAIDKRNAVAPFIKELLLAVDRLRTNAPSDELNQSVCDEIVTILDRYGVTAIDNTGTVDPKVHEVVGLVPADDDGDAGTITEVVRPGYLIGDVVLRPSQVVVSQ
ncbi:nucleotide exchange factor GrpE [Bifidobacterium pseudolongum subsp. globosum]|uniref:Protein GrpE n=1 Tax=Bifidobacterium pseudolongum subsp. globosum TaxID=1690 RepID=A0A4V1Y5E9_9BIFI|nr:nucleotide exchange factor GrpE [Bifidobacterium pseudolongum]MCH4859753.1 nucleotide exchange factor GrpE [Bifidobacterium pseudolongum]MCH4861524.1 nucleotide exchange factor GrpE [Bifidobacterium pseudolongum]RYQ40606.1 nucleotide exchange factor GrpE [Bifidobacterium pseudolongum subsp. globosum]